MNKIILSILILLLASPHIESYAQVFKGFEKNDLQYFKPSEDSRITLSSRAKQGEQSIRWDFTPNSSLDILLPEDVHPYALQMKEKRSGIQLWIYNDVADQSIIHFSFLDHQGDELCSLNYIRATKGWRAAWIDFSAISYNTTDPDKQIERLRLTAPNETGFCLLDRLTFPVVTINERTTPDAQLPNNHSLPDRPLFHWCRLWEWEQYRSDLTPKKALNTEESKAIQTIERRLDERLCEKTSQGTENKIKKAQKLYIEKGFKQLKDTIIGPPLVSTDECDKKAGELDLTDLNTLISGFGLDYLTTHQPSSLKTFLALFDYAIDQGFAWGSGMGTNHHYGYKIRDIYDVAFRLRHEIAQAPHGHEIIRALDYWSSSSETRQACKRERDELLDSWHTLLIPKILMAFFTGNESYKELRIRQLQQWLSSSMAYTNGTIGGFKTDGTGFHHGGFYPAYTTGAIGAIGEYMTVTHGTPYTITPDAREPLTRALLAACFYSEVRDFPITLGGRHPFYGGLSEFDAEAWAELALTYPHAPKSDILGGEYLRLLGQTETPNAKALREAGLKPYTPQGFRVYNYGATGAYRVGEALVAIKGFNRHVWNTETYRHDNRYGRYLSYGSVIIQHGSREASGYLEGGYDWGRIPGATAIYLPIDSLDPIKSVFMRRNLASFSGASTLDETSGIFATAILEPDQPSFTPDFKAHKSVFCFGPYLLCMGSGISNSNSRYPTETTLFQVASDKQGETTTTRPDRVICDGYNNYYLLPTDALVTVYRNKHQQSRDNRGLHETEGTFDVAIWSHDKAPKDASYHYTVLPHSAEATAQDFKEEEHFKILVQTPALHGMTDLKSGTYAYAVFDDAIIPNDPLMTQASKECLIMWQRHDHQVMMSVCDPDLNLESMSYTTPGATRPKTKTITLTDGWRLAEGSSDKVSQSGNILTITCVNGDPTIFKLVK